VGCVNLPRLPDGTPVGIRPMVPADRRWLAAAVERLSPTSRYSRFLSPMRTLDEAMLARLVDSVDGVDHVAVVATLDPGGPADARAAVGRYVRWPQEPATAEMAITVTDVVQGRGIGRVVAADLARRAREGGITTFTAVVGADNTASVRTLARLGTVTQQSFSSPGVLELRVDLGSPV
jgi:GNAT superfamily N-acetyltransferase